MPRKKQQYGLGSIFRKKTKDKDGKEREIPTWYIQFYVDGRCYRESTGTTVYNEAQKKLKARIAEVEQGIMPEATAKKVYVSELLDDLLAHYKRHNPKSVDTFANGIIDRLRKSFGELLATKVQSAELQQFVDGCLAIPLAPATINRHMALLRKAFRLGFDHQPKKVRVMPNFAPFFLEENNVRQGFFEHAEYMKIRDAMPADERGPVVFAYYSGCRASEILNLQWDQVDWTGRVVRLWAGETKNGQGRVLPMSEELHAMLHNQWVGKPDGCPWVFYRGDGGRVCTVRYGWDAAVEATKVTRNFHDLRRTAVRNMVRAGVPEKVAMAISGHKTRAVFERYNIVDEGDLHEATGKLEAYLGTQGAAAGCTGCGSQVPAGARFCPQCGDKI